VQVGGETTGSIGRGVLALVGVERGDGEREAERLAERVLGYRIFPDAEGKMNRSVGDVGGEILVVPQFTLYGDARRGRRPSRRRQHGRPKGRTKTAAPRRAPRAGGTPFS